MAAKAGSKTPTPRHKSTSQIEIWLQEIETSIQDNEGISPEADSQARKTSSTPTTSSPPPTTNQVPSQQPSSSLWRKLSSKKRSYTPKSSNTLVILARKLSLSPRTPIDTTLHTKMYSHPLALSPHNSNRSTSTESSISISSHDEDAFGIGVKRNGMYVDEESEDDVARRKRERLERAAKLLEKVNADAKGTKSNMSGAVGKNEQEAGEEVLA